MKNTPLEGKRETKPGNVQPDLIIEGGMVITLAKGQDVMRDTDVFVSNGRIMDIRMSGGEGVSAKGQSEVIDARNAIVMPGLVNAHSHSAMTLFRGFADDYPLKQWLYEKIFPVEARFINQETVYWGSLLGCVEMIASGTTCLSDGYFFQDETLQAIHESGLRAIVAQGVLDFPAPGVENPKENLKKAREFVEKWINFSEMIKPGIFCHSAVTCSDQTMVGAQNISKEFGLPLQMHLSETEDEVNEIVRKTGLRTVKYLDQLGLIDEDLIVAHGIHLDDEELTCLREKGTKVVHVPESNMKLSSGVARIDEMVKMGITVGLGTDGCASNNNLDLFQEMDTAAKLGKVFSLDPESLDAKTVLNMATKWGASVLGLEKEIGTLEKGKKADIIVIDLKSPHMIPIYDPFSALVYAANGSDVKDVIVNGKILMKDRQFMNLDVNRILKSVTGISKEIKKYM